MPVVTDIETCPTERALALEPTEAELQGGIQANWKAETVLRKIAENREAWAGQLRKRASLDWRLCQVLCAGLLIDDGRHRRLRIWTTSAPVNPKLQGALLKVAQPIVDRANDLKQPIEVHHEPVASEAALLQRYWDAYESVRFPSSRTPDNRLVGFNHRSFDLPVLFGRSAVHGVRVPTIKTYRFDRARNGTIDWSEILNWYGAFPATSWTLGRYADWFDLLWKPRGSGSDIAQWLSDGRWDLLLEHQAYDLLATWALDHRMAPAWLE